MSKTSRMNAGLTTALVLGVALAAAVLINIISANVYGRLDLTANEINSLSAASRDAVATLDDLEVRVYISSDLPETVTDADTGRNIILRDVARNFRDKLEEYRSLSDGSMTLSYVREDVVDMAEAAKIRLFAGEEASTTKEGFLEFKQYALGASFHYKNAMEVLPKAFEPEFYEFEITKILVRLKEKVS